MFTVGYCSVRTKLLKVILKVKLTCPDNLLASILEAVVFMSVVLYIIAFFVAELFRGFKSRLLILYCCMFSVIAFALISLCKCLISMVWCYKWYYIVPVVFV